MKQVQIIISGFVQGVGYRQFVKNLAKKYGVVGWVKNLPAGKAGTSNGKVEVLLQGEKEAIEHIIAACRRGTGVGEVRGVVVEWGEGKEHYFEFKIFF